MSKVRNVEVERPSVKFLSLGPKTRETLQRVMATYDNIPVDPEQRFEIQSREMLHAILWTKPEDLSK